MEWYLVKVRSFTAFPVVLCVFSAIFEEGGIGCGAPFLTNCCERSRGTPAENEMEGIPKIFISQLVVKCLLKRISLSVPCIKHVRNVRDYRRPVFLELPITSQRQQT